MRLQRLGLTGGGHAQIGQHHHDQLARILRPLRHLNRRPSRRSATDPAENPFLRGHLPRHIGSVFVLHLHALVDNLHVQHIGNEPRANALNLVRTGLAAGKHCRSGGLNGNDFNNLPFRLLEVAGNAGNCPARTDARDKNVDFPIQVVPDLWAGRSVVNLGVGRILKLLGHKVLGVFLKECFCLPDGSRHSLLAGGEHHERPKGLQYLPAFHAHGLGHGQNQFVSPGRGDKSQSYPRVTGGWLYNCPAGLEHPAFLRVPHHAGADAALYRLPRISALHFPSLIHI